MSNCNPTVLPLPADTARVALILLLEPALAVKRHETLPASLLATPLLAVPVVAIVHPSAAGVELAVARSE